MADPRGWGVATRLVRGGLERTEIGEVAEALFLTQSYVYDSAEAADARFAGKDAGYIYTRYGNPTVAMFERRLALLEGAEACRATASGMAAVHLALCGLLRAGDHVVAAKALFGSCRWLLSQWAPRFGIETSLVDGPDLAQWRAAAKPNTRVFLVETPANPLLELTDIARVAEIAHAAGARVVVDNVFATPIFQAPLDLGADLVVYSATKHIDGGGRVLGGAVLGARALLEEAFRDLIRHTGPALSPFNAWVLLKGLETLDLRVRAQSATASRLADLLADHPKVAACRYPTRPDFPQQALAVEQMTGGGSLVAFDLGSEAAAFRFLNALRLIDLSNNLGDAKSLITHPWTTTHRAMPEAERAGIGLTPGWVRLSVGLETAADLERDLLAALEKA